MVLVEGVGLLESQCIVEDRDGLLAPGVGVLLGGVAGGEEGEE